MPRIKISNAEMEEIRLLVEQAHPGRKATVLDDTNSALVADNIELFRRWNESRVQCTQWKLASLVLGLLVALLCAVR